MATALKNLSNYDPATLNNIQGKRFGIVVSDYNRDITFSLLKACHQTLIENGAIESDIIIAHVPGSFELPLGAKMLHDKHAKTSTPLDALICIGCVITGETKHDDYINQAISQGIMQLNLSYGKPFVFGVLTPRTHQQALDRAGGKHGNKGVEAAVAAIKMLDF